ncbi:uncharacterized protein VTP21DRAFT_8565 [Calcarisporiella thermophila]|uniref:uncharacterized protein n=1 Tax=Calcarisporiella thermophila TaxID=911321 RepID=UPI0037420128
MMQDLTTNANNGIHSLPTNQDIPFSILDNDLYKFTMQQFVFIHFRDIPVKYRFKNRSPTIRLNEPAIEWLKSRIQGLEKLSLTADERQFLEGYSFFSREYLEFLQSFRYRPAEQVNISLDSDGDLQLNIQGFWHEVILYEVPLLALVSEAYFRFVDLDWNYDGQESRAKAKAMKLLQHGCVFSEFGTRRRRDYYTQDIVVRVLARANKEHLLENPGSQGKLVGTSNVHFAHKYGLTAVGTLAHELFMGVSALEGVANANRLTLEKWHDTYKGQLGIALTDTFGTEVFFRDFGGKLANAFSGVRHDSGDPFGFVDRVVEHYRTLGINASQKVIMFSDSLTPELAIQLKEHCDSSGVKCAFGIGTNFTNDFERKGGGKSVPMNIVIKLSECRGIPVVKLSDEKTKHSGPKEAVQDALRILGLPLD